MQVILDVLLEKNIGNYHSLSRYIIVFQVNFKETCKVWDCRKTYTYVLIQALEVVRNDILKAIAEEELEPERQEC